MSSQRTYWVVRSRQCLAVSSGPLRSILDTVLRFRSKSRASSRELRLRFRVRIRSSSAQSMPGYLLGFRSPSRPRHRESTKQRASHARLTFRPQCFSHSRRVSPLDALQAYFILQPRPGFHFRGFPRYPAIHLSMDCAFLTLRLILLLLRIADSARQ